MSTSRRNSTFVNLSTVDVDEQERELQRLLQEKSDREFAARLQRDFEQDQNVNTNPPPSPPVIPEPQSNNQRNAPGPIRRQLGPRRPHPTTSRRVSTSQYDSVHPNLLRGRPPTPARRRSNGLVVTISSEDSDTNDDLEGLNITSDGSYSSDAESFHEERPSRISQPLQGDDANMYRRELELAHEYEGAGQPSTSAAAAAVYNPPPRLGVPDGRWGDCLMCFEVPIEPRGCNSCHQVLGCKTCVVSWHRASANSSCPLCRRKWHNTPDVSSMTTIERRRRLHDRNVNSRSTTA